MGKPDYFNDFNSTYLGHPINNEKQGKFGLRLTNPNNELEAITTELSTELTKNTTYKISFSMIQCQYSNYSTKIIPILFSKRPFSSELSPTFGKEDQSLIYVETIKPYIAKDGWQTIVFYFKANGGEKYFTLLNSPTIQSIKEQYNRMSFNFTDNDLEGASYYFFTDFSIEKADDENQCTTQPIENPLYKNNLKIQSKNQLDQMVQAGLIDTNKYDILDQHLVKKDYLFLIDVSGSMVDKLYIAKEKAIQEIEETCLDQSISLVTFNGDSQIIGDKENSHTIIQKIKNLAPYGETNLYSGILQIQKLINPNNISILHIYTDVAPDAISGFKLYESIKISTSLTEYKYICSPTQNNNNRNIDTAQLKSSEEKNTWTDINEGFMSNFKYFYLVQECEGLDTSVVNKVNEQDKITNNVYLIDQSSSMNKNNKISSLKNAIINYNQSLDLNNTISLVSFSSKTTVLLNSVAPNDPLFNSTIESLEAKGTTKINEGITYIYKHYAQNTENENISFTLFTDGVFKLSEESKKLITGNSKIYFTVFQFGGKTNKTLTELMQNNNLNYKKISQKRIVENLILAKKNMRFPTKYSEFKPEIWKDFQKNIFEYTRYK